GGRAPAGEPQKALGDPASVDLKKLRVAYYVDDGTMTACPASRRAVREASEILAAAGAQTFEWAPPDVDQAVALLYSVFAADGAKGFKRMLGKNPRDPRVKEIEMAGSTPGFMIPLVRKVLGAMGRGKSADVLLNYGRHDTDWYWQITE